MPAKKAAVGSKSFGRWIKRRREDLGIYQDLLADTIGWSSATQRRVEHGQRGVDEGEIILLARALELDEEEVRARAHEDVAPERTAARQGISDDDVDRIARRLADHLAERFGWEVSPAEKVAGILEGVAGEGHSR